MTNKAPTRGWIGKFGNYLSSHPWLRATLGASAVATLIATGLANAETNPQSDIVVASASAEAGDVTVTGSVGTSDVVPGEGELSLPSVSLDVSVAEAASRLVGGGTEKDLEGVTETDVKTVDVNEMEYARRFDLDPNATVASTEVGVDGAVDIIRDKLADGWKLNGVEIYGTASDEDDTLSEDGVTESSDAGLDVPAPTRPGEIRNNNELLADVRGETGSQLFQEKVLASLGIDVSQITDILPGQEIINHELNDKIRALANNYQVKPLELLDAFNSIGAKDLEARLKADTGAMDTLNVLKEHRAFIISMEFEKTVLKPIPVFREGKWVTEIQERKVMHVELVPVFFPLFLIAMLAKRGIKIKPTEMPPKPVGPPLPPNLVLPNNVLPKPVLNPSKPPIAPKPTYPTPDIHKRKAHLKGGPTRPGFKRRAYSLRDPGTASQANRGPVTTHRGNKLSTGRTPRRSVPKGRKKR